MNKYKYKIFYLWEGQTHSSPTVTMKNEVQILDAIYELEKELLLRTAEYSTKAAMKKIGTQSAELEITTKMGESDFDEQMRKVLQVWDLRAEKN